MRLCTFHRLWVAIHAPPLWNTGTLSVILSQKPSVQTTCQCTHPLFLPNDYVTPLPAICVILTHPLLRMQRVQQHPLHLYTKELHFLLLSSLSLNACNAHIYSYIYVQQHPLPLYTKGLVNSTVLFLNSTSLFKNSTQLLLYSLCLSFSLSAAACDSPSCFAITFNLCGLFRVHASTIHHQLFPERREPREQICCPPI